MSDKSLIRVGTRGSELALAQTRLVIEALSQSNPLLEFRIVEVVTQGDRSQHSSQPVRDKREWIHELEQDLISNKIDIAVHSAKDVPIDINSLTSVCAVLKRSQVEDVIIFKSELSQSIQTLPIGASIATSSNRRSAQLMRLRPDFQIVPIRGNVPTRIKKLQTSDTLHGTVLAQAGLERLGIDLSCIERLTPEVMVPAMNQGILAVQYLSENTLIQQELSKICDGVTNHAFLAERECIKILGADCDSAIGVYADVRHNRLKIVGRVLSNDGKQSVEAFQEGNQEDDKNIGALLAGDLIEMGALSLLELSRSESKKCSS